jgi:hypothetical protein
MLPGRENTRIFTTFLQDGMRAPSLQVACVGRSARPPGRKVVVLHGPRLKILVDDLCQRRHREM